ncbi:MAG: WYL domain-containing protein [Chitinivibrionales bacterium]|nr:WYL domain-containing protein [Chitinivibrionales bacterium]
MTPYDRIYRLHRLLKNKRRRRLDELMEALECSRATVMRAIGFMRVRLRAPIEYDHVDGVYFYDLRDGHPFELPGLWLSGREIAALAALDALVEQLEPGLLRESLRMVRSRAQELCSAGGLDSARLAECIKLLPMGNRRVPPPLFSTIAEALLGKRTLSFTYDAGSAPGTRRTVSPQHLVHYRDNWYLDGWCHRRGGVRTYALCGIADWQFDSTAYKHVPRKLLEEHFVHSYGLFAGAAKTTAVIHFHDIAARYVSREQWHPKQKGRWLDETTYELRIPIGDSREIQGDVLRWGELAEVIEPGEMRETIGKRLRMGALRYEG